MSRLDCQKMPNHSIYKVNAKVTFKGESVNQNLIKKAVRFICRLGFDVMRDWCFIIYTAL